MLGFRARLLSLLARRLQLALALPHEIMRLPAGAGNDRRRLRLRSVNYLPALRRRSVNRLLPLASRRLDDRVSRFARLLEDAARLLAHALEGVPHRRLRRAGDLELGDQRVHLLHVAVDLAPLVSAHGGVERHVPDLTRYVAGQCVGRRRVGPLARSVALRGAVATPFFHGHCLTPGCSHNNRRSAYPRRASALGTTRAQSSSS